MTDKVAITNAIVSRHMDEILELFKPGAKITVMVRRPGNPEGDFVLTNDDQDGAKAICERRFGK